MLDILSESDNNGWFSRLQFLKFGGELLVVAANQNQLDTRVVEFFGDVDHYLRSMASEQNNACRTIGFQSESFPFFSAIDTRLYVELWLQDHSGCLEDMAVGVAHCQRLLPGAFRPDNDVLRLRLDPEVWWVVRQIRY